MCKNGCEGRVGITVVKHYRVKFVDGYDEVFCNNCIKDVFTTIPDMVKSVEEIKKALEYQVVGIRWDDNKEFKSEKYYNFDDALEVMRDMEKYDIACEIKEAI
jgi:hypothetical protein